MREIVELFIFVTKYLRNYNLMKKLLLLFIFLGTFVGFSSNLKAQIKEPGSISQKADDGVLVAYPNPAKDFLIVKAKDTSLKIKSVTFYSILGTQVANYSVNMNTGEINIEKLKPGKYLIRYILSDNTQKVTQIVKQ
ncbi:Por secretion system C-terminal sorting domain-containing protein [Chryseobacterium soldanellicola]|uniref:Por secretion system C-terminal sorting domain-containing protein n=2 Tax=Chryseobacterium soldanellicola TaxID=311333 RepID=A0A1H1D8F2_9FLAO|nr:Por secretion system C-terminal sorting domain-containing protein [Chryseobacterium soldanellicola]